jgi:hypothetical protein
MDSKMGRCAKRIPVCAYGIESDIAQVQKARKPHHDVEADAEDHINSNIPKNLSPVVACKRREKSDKENDSGNEEPTGRDFEFVTASHR